MLNKLIENRWCRAILVGLLMFGFSHLGIWLEGLMSVKTPLWWTIAAYAPYVSAIVGAGVAFSWD